MIMNYVSRTEMSSIQVAEGITHSLQNILCCLDFIFVNIHRRQRQNEIEKSNIPDKWLKLVQMIS